MPEHKTTLSARFTDEELQNLRWAGAKREWSVAHIIRKGALRLADQINNPPGSPENPIPHDGRTSH